MKIALSIIAGFVLVVTAILFFTHNSGPKTYTNLPWQITTTDDGSSKVFGVELESTSFSDAALALGYDREIAVIIDQQDNAKLEMYFTHFRAGPLQGKLVVTASSEPTLLRQLAENALESEYLGTGSRKFTLSATPPELAANLPVKTLTFIPTAQLDREVVETRFGTPAEVITVDDNSVHMLYPKLGLDVVINKEGKETLQYVAPRSFEQLSRGLAAYRQPSVGNDEAEQK